MNVILVKAEDVRVGDYLERGGCWTQVRRIQAGLTGFLEDHDGENPNPGEGSWVSFYFNDVGSSDYCWYRPEWLLMVGRSTDGP
jgi:hypothetical protein